MIKFPTDNFPGTVLVASILLLFAGMSSAQNLPARPDEQLPASAMPIVSMTLNGRKTDLVVEDLRNPMVLIQTTRGDMVLELFRTEAPTTIRNFLDLAEGNKTTTDISTGNDVQRPFYDGLNFYRIIPGFVVQGGSPSGQANGNPGYSLKHEINADALGLDRMLLLDPEGFPNPILRIQDEADFKTRILTPLYAAMNIRSPQTLAARIGDVDSQLRKMSIKDYYQLLGYSYTTRVQSRAPVKGSIAMVSDGPEQNGSQFFITLDDQLWMAGRYTVFGKIRGGEEVLNFIARSPTDAQGRPFEDIVILAIRQIRL